MQRPSKRQHELLSFVRGFIDRNGYGPSYREIMEAFKYKSVSTVAIHVDGLVKKGYLKKRDNEARSLDVVGPTQVDRFAQFLKDNPDVSIDDALAKFR